MFEGLEQGNKMKFIGDTEQQIPSGLSYVYSRHNRHISELSTALVTPALTTLCLFVNWAEPHLWAFTVP